MPKPKPKRALWSALKAKLLLYWFIFNFSRQNQDPHPHPAPGLITFHCPHPGCPLIYLATWGDRALPGVSGWKPGQVWSGGIAVIRWDSSRKTSSSSIKAMLGSRTYAESCREGWSARRLKCTGTLERGHKKSVLKERGVTDFQHNASIPAKLTLLNCEISFFQLHQDRQQKQIIHPKFTNNK